MLRATFFPVSGQPHRARAGLLSRLALAALLASAALSSSRSAAQPYSDPGPGFGVHGAAEFPAQALGATVSGGFHYRFRLTGGLGVEAAVGYREARYDVAGGVIFRLQSMPVTGSLLLFPWPDHPVQPYALAGAGYNLVKLRSENLTPQVEGTENQFSFLAGAGVEAQVSRTVSLFLDGRYAFLPVDALQSFGISGRYASVTFGVTYRY